jgi:hypothetical protein
MLQFSQGSTSVELILTLSENKTVNEPVYYFLFTHTETKQSVSFIKKITDEESSYTNRYNKFTIDASVVFGDKPTGEWHYQVFELGAGYVIGDYNHNLTQIIIPEFADKNAEMVFRNNGDSWERIEIWDGESVPAFSFIKNNSVFLFPADANLQDTDILYIDERLTVLEKGKLMLGRAVEFEYAVYNQASSFKTYNG